MGLSYLALGDSYTIGEAVAVEGRWPHQLAAALRAQGIDLADPQTVATTGWTTDELDAGIDEVAPKGPFDFVSLLIGVNNQYRGRPLDEYQLQFQALLQRAIGFAGGRADRVLVLSFPDWGATPFGIQSGRHLTRIGIETDEFNAAAKVISAQQGVAFVDITDISRDNGTDPAMIAEDGLHPSAVMYALWSARALPVTADLLSRTD
ncbi:SGNH/GDSL hydrolase family protein [Stenotrophomonas sp. NA06056]|uniref:SGNH/GDSL hydrolase family protein n=1 Tax=Stenotrophomonas sp. NA06056 TaxID=2742129 RepID=UPI00158F54D1|nr:SGNH/GDSL hydrolase family protein [Stenotrophomonas sp. NA06056]QKW55595.1 SGNH/GDSL hydrolase family protein [Stenotrophomonas sp. NA06056]